MGRANRYDMVGLARALSKLGYSSRSRAEEIVRAGHVSVNGLVQKNPGARVDLNRDVLKVAGQRAPGHRLYLMLNKPRGLVTTAADERGRETVYSCLPGLPWLFPVGRLDKASEGLLLFTNDTRWAEDILSPQSHIPKTYHVHIDCLPEDGALSRMLSGIRTGEGETLSVRAVRPLREGSRNSWLEVVLDRGKNRHIRRILEALGIDVLRLVRVAIGPLLLGDLPKGEYRHLSETEKTALSPTLSSRKLY